MIVLFEIRLKFHQRLLLHSSLYTIVAKDKNAKITNYHLLTSSIRPFVAVVHSTFDNWFSFVHICDVLCGGG